MIDIPFLFGEWVGRWSFFFVCSMKWSCSKNVTFCCVLWPAFFFALFFFCCYEKNQSQTILLSALPSHIIVSLCLCVLVRWPHHIAQNHFAWLQLTKHIIGVEKNASFFFSSFFIIFSVQYTFRVHYLFKIRKKSAFDVESESFTFTSVPKTITICLEDYRCCATLFFFFLPFITSLMFFFFFELKWWKNGKFAHNLPVLSLNVRLWFVHTEKTNCGACGSAQNIHLAYAECRNSK